MSALRITLLLASSILVGITPAVSADSAWLAGSQWGYPPEPGVTDRRFVRFAADGQVHGNGGCNSFRGRYDQTGGAITIGPLATTRKACAQEIMARESSFLSVLTTARGVQATHFKLVLLAADGTELVRLVRQDWD